MSSVVIAGNTSGTVTLNAPDIAGTTVLTLPTTSGTILTTASGQWITTGSNIYYNTGNVGIGTSSPTARLDVTGSSFATANVNFAQRTDDTTVSTATTWSSSSGNWMTRNNGGALTFNSGNTIGSSVGTERMTLTSAGFLGIGETSPNTILHANGDIRSTNASSNFSRFSFGQYGSSGTSYSFIQGDARDTGYMAFYTNVTERMRITSAGVLVVGATTQSYGEKLRVYNAAADGNAAFFWHDSTADRDVLIIRNERATGSTAAGMMSFLRSGGVNVGSIYSNGSGTTYATSSDYRLKENIAPMTGALAKVSALKPCTYTWKDGGLQGQGFIAHELAEVCPDAVVGEKDATQMQSYEISPAVPATYDEEGNELTPAVEAVMGEREVPKYQGVDTSFLVATLTAAIQEQQAIITDLKARIEVLENK